MRTVVVQVEGCEVAVLVGYRPGTGEPTEAILAQVAARPKSRMLDALRGVMTAYAMAPLAIAVDGKPAVPTGVRVKVGLEAGGARPIVIVLVTFAVASAGRLTVTTLDPRTTRISWQDRSTGRVDLAAAPTQDHWYAGVASFLLSLGAGDATCSSTSASLR